MLATTAPSVRTRHVGLVAGYALRRLLRSRAAAAFALLVAVTAVFVVDSIVAPIELEEGVTDPARWVASVSESQHLAGLVTWVTGGDSEHAGYLLRERPAILSGILLVLLMATPFLAAAGSFDQTAGDIGSRWLRFALLRTERTSIFLGRFVAAALAVLAVQGVLLAAIVAYLDWRVGLYPTGALVTWGLWGWVAVAALALPYVALCAVVSAATRSSLVSLSLCAVVVALPIFGLGFAASNAEAGFWLERVHPWGWKYGLLHPETVRWAKSLAAMLLFTAGFLALGAAWFRRRDL